MDLGEGSLETTLDKADAVYNALKPDQTRQVAGATTIENLDSTDKSESERPAVPSDLAEQDEFGTKAGELTMDKAHQHKSQKKHQKTVAICIKDWEKGHITAEMCHPALGRVMFLHHKRNQISEIETS